MASANARRIARVLCDAPAQLVLARGRIRGTCRNLSTEGMFFTGPLLAVGEPVALTLSLSGLGEVHAKGCVQYQHAYADGAGVGIHFTEVEAEHLARIRRFVKAGAPEESAEPPPPLYNSPFDAV